MKLLALAVAGLLFVALAALPAKAAAFTFGDSEDLTTIVDVGVTGADGEALMLGYKTTTHNFLLPWSMSDDGYVLVQKDDPDHYYSMTAEEIAQWQAAGLLPDPLPAYEIPLLDRIMGYLAWPTLVIIVGAAGIGQLLKRRKQDKVGAAAE